MPLASMHLLQMLPGGGGVTVSTSMLVLTFSQPASSVSTTGGKTVTPSMLVLTLSQPASTVSAGGAVTVTPGELTLTLSQPTQTVSTGRTVSVSELSLTLSIPSATTNLAGDIWHQHAADASRRGSGTLTPAQPWRWLWSYNGPDSAGATTSHTYHAPAEAYPVCGNGRMYVPRGSTGLATLSLTDGSLTWEWPYKEVVASPAYSLTLDCVIVADTEGWIHKFPGSTGGISAGVYSGVKSFNCGSPILKAVCLVSDRYAYVSCEDGSLQKIDCGTTAGASLSRSWRYSGGSSAGFRAETPPSYAPTTGKLVYATSDGYVHAVIDAGGSAGTASWRVKPSSNTWGGYVSFDRAWPVVADAHGVVLLRCNLQAVNGGDALSTTPGSGTPFPGTGVVATDCASTRTWLNANTNSQVLFAMSLTDGSASFVPAVGYGGVEDYHNGQSASTMGSQPVVRRFSNGDEVAFIHFRNGYAALANGWDYRWDSMIGEMVLDGTTISGLAAGDLRMVKMGNQWSGGDGYARITDEQCPLTVCGDTIFHSHWAGAESAQIASRLSSITGNGTDPITATANPTVIRAKGASGTRNAVAHYHASNGSAAQSRSYTAPVFWVYWAPGSGDEPPGSPAGTSTYSAGWLPRYTFVHQGYIVVVGNGGDISVLRHSGTNANVAAPSAPTAITIAGPTTAEVAQSTIYRFAFNSDTIKSSGTVVVTPTDGPGSGTFSPSTLSLTQTNPGGETTYTANSADAGGNVSLTCTNDGSLSNP